MATVNGYTAEKMKEIADSAFKAAAVVGDDLILTHQDNSQTNLGSVRGPQGFPGISDMSLYDPLGVPKPLLILPIPGGHGVCDGTTEYDVADAPVLAAAFGSGPACVNGPAAVGKIKLPDLRGKTIFGLHPGITAFDTLLESGGSKDAVVVYHDHTADQLPHGHGADVHIGGVDHYHGTGNAGSHSHTVGGDPDWASDRIVWTYGPSSNNVGTGGQEVTYTHIDPVGDHNHGNTGWATAYNHDHGITIDTTDPAIDVHHEGVSGTDKNLPPYMVANWIMRLG